VKERNKKERQEEKREGVRERVIKRG